MGSDRRDSRRPRLRFLGQRWSVRTQTRTSAIPAGYSLPDAEFPEDQVIDLVDINLACRSPVPMNAIAGITDVPVCVSSDRVGA